MILDMHSYEEQEQTLLNLLKILALGQYEIEQGLFQPADKVFFNLDKED